MVRACTTAAAARARVCVRMFKSVDVGVGRAWEATIQFNQTPPFSFPPILYRPLSTAPPSLPAGASVTVGRTVGLKKDEHFLGGKPVKRGDIGVRGRDYVYGGA
jgi:hypothetical protein